MKNDERNRLMDAYSSRFTGHCGSFGSFTATFEQDSPLDKAIRECDRKARAWDALEDYAQKNNYMLMLAEMQKILAPPKPKSKFQWLRHTVDRLAMKSLRCGQTYGPAYVLYDDLVTEIDRLDAETSTED